MSRSSAIITIGNEILLGRTLNTNLAWLASELALAGVPVTYAIVVQDQREQILQALQDTWGKYDIVITTGGLGPTPDDITKASIAEYFGKELQFDPDVWDNVQMLFSRRNMPAPESNRSQALVPAGFTALHNELGTAPGL
ncbi:MAG TPA: competence/damage-inducible protein A, partial [Candidatus Cloacimonadota bacterium]|nr:competence/damage-inducible protein A [Candidatus Cloacimonadota bacterium]